MTAASASVSCALRPAAGSSSSKQARLRGERARDFEQTLLAVGEQLGILPGLGGEADESEQFARFGVHVGFLAAEPGEPREGRSDAALGRKVETDLDVLGDRHAFEELYELESAHQSHRGDPVLPQMGDVLAGEFDRSRRGRKEARHHVEEGRLAGAVRADDGEQTAFRDFQTDVAVGRQSGEPLGQIAHREQRHGSAPGAFFSGARPADAGQRGQSLRHIDEQQQEN